jgi:hypothetical protein
MLQLKWPSNQRNKSEIRISWFDAAHHDPERGRTGRNPKQTQRQINLKSGKSKTPNANQVVWNILVFFSDHLNLVRISKFGFGASNFGHLKLFRVSDFVLRIFLFLAAFAQLFLRRLRLERMQPRNHFFAEQTDIVQHQLLGHRAHAHDRHERAKAAILFVLRHEVLVHSVRRAD